MCYTVQLLLQVFREARRVAPSVVFIPRISSWWDVTTEAFQAMFLSTLHSLPSSTAILMLATSECPWGELPAALREVFEGVRELHEEDRSTVYSFFLLSSSLLSSLLHPPFLLPFSVLPFSPLFLPFSLSPTFLLCTFLLPSSPSLPSRPLSLFLLLRLAANHLQFTLPPWSRESSFSSRSSSQDPHNLHPPNHGHVAVRLLTRSLSEHLVSMVTSWKSKKCT